MDVSVESRYNFPVHVWEKKNGTCIAACLIVVIYLIWGPLNTGLNEYKDLLHSHSAY